MKVTHIPTSELITPAKLAATLARYSRSNEGIDKILEFTKTHSVDQIFKYIDYGHASIGGLTGGIAIAMDGISALLAARLFEFAQMADGQESSTRYIVMDPDACLPAQTIGTPPAISELRSELEDLAMKLYRDSISAHEQALESGAIELNLSHVADDRVKQRMRRNYALDRSRYFLPVTYRTNVALVATARIWADIIRLVSSLLWQEADELADLLRGVLKDCVPELTKHSLPNTASRRFVHETHALRSRNMDFRSFTRPCEALVRLHQVPPVMFDDGVASLQDGLRHREGRYDHAGVRAKHTPITVKWTAMALAEIRDLQRHRTGARGASWNPVGFYLPTSVYAMIDENSEFADEVSRFRKLYVRQLQELCYRTPPGGHCYGMYFGTQMPFVHTQQLDKFIYELELRTGVGAHFRYAEHMRDAADALFAADSSLRAAVNIGAAEQEVM